MVEWFLFNVLQKYQITNLIITIEMGTESGRLIYESTLWIVAFISTNLTLGVTLLSSRLLFLFTAPQDLLISTFIGTPPPGEIQSESYLNRVNDH